MNRRLASVGLERAQAQVGIGHQVGKAALSDLALEELLCLA